MVEAHLDLYHEAAEPVGWVPDILQALRETKFLALERYTTQCLFRAPAFEFPEFHRLVNQKVDVPHVNMEFLLTFLHNCHVLEGLVIHICKAVYCPSVEYNGPTPPTMVPNCVTSHLKSFEFRDCQDTRNEREFIAYLYKKGLF